MYIADYDYHMVYYVDVEANKLYKVFSSTTSSNNGDGGFASLGTVYYPSGLAVDNQGTIPPVTLVGVNQSKSKEPPRGISN